MSELTQGAGTGKAGITERQNEPGAQRLLRAATTHYLRAKRWHFLRVAGTLGLAAAAPVVVFWAPKSAEIIAAMAGGWTVIGRTLFRFLERRNQHLGARIHEQFDVELFDLGWNGAIAGDQVAPEDVVDAAGRRNRKLDRLRDWYPDTPGAVWPRNVLISQRSSAAWARRDHSVYATTIVTVATLWGVLGIAVGILKGLTLAQYLIRLFLPSQPAMLDAAEFARAHFLQARERGLVESRINQLLEQSSEDQATGEACRSVQDQIFRLRAQAQQIPQWFYLLRRKRNQEAMRQAAVIKAKSPPTS